MTLIESVSAITVLADFALFTENQEERIKIECLITAIREKGKTLDFEWYIENEFPNGTDKDELVQFCTTHSIEYIFEGMKN